MKRSLPQLREIVDGRTVALVGNASSILGSGVGKRIDEHDVVIRMNLGIFGVPYVDAGYRTDVWAAAKYWPEARSDAKLIVFMKLTPLGDRHWNAWQRDFPHDPLVRWPRHLEDECRAFVGADPGTGIRLLWWLKKHAEPKSVSVFGFDCWETASHWSGKKQTPNHSPAMERIAMRILLG